tara:strand:+ start:2450 stop:3301 length:852 start_codon:yes stop_codon:yes gene_type:complete
MWTNEYQPNKYGYQVLLSVHNGEKYMRQCLKSLDDSLAGLDWVLLYGDDSCTDETSAELAKYVRGITCDKVHLYEYDKASTVGAAKNRLIKEAHTFKEDYPVILFMDVDDQMLPERPRMIKTAVKENSSYVVGGWQRISQGSKFKDSESVCDKLQFGPWATLFDCDFLPEDGHFFPEDEFCNTGYEDILTWYHLKYIENKIATPHPSDNPVHQYIQRQGSVSNGDDLNYKRNMFWGISHLIKDNKRDIYKNPVSREEAEEAMNEYAKSKEIENVHSKSTHPID